MVVSLDGVRAALPAVIVFLSCVVFCVGVHVGEEHPQCNDEDDGKDNEEDSCHEAIPSW